MFLLREQGFGTRRDTEQHFTHAGLRVQDSLELGSIEAIRGGRGPDWGLLCYPASRSHLKLQAAIWLYWM